MCCRTQGVEVMDGEETDLQRFTATAAAESGGLETLTQPGQSRPCQPPRILSTDERTADRCRCQWSGKSHIIMRTYRGFTLKTDA
ncbi:hypothetical protein AOLI_G00313710 [Acnodon oligacanthus]